MSKKKTPANTKVLEHLELVLVAEAEPSGSEWEIVIISEGRSKNAPPLDYNYTAEALQQGVSVFEGVAVYANELAKEYFAHLSRDQRAQLGAGAGITRNLVGIVENVHYGVKEGVRGLHGTYKVAAPWMRELLRGAWQLGRETARKMLGFSIDAQIQLDSSNNVIAFGPRPVLDAVSQPAAGGQLTRAIAALQEGDLEMNEFLAHLLAALAASGLPDVASAKLKESWETKAKADGADFKALTTEFDAAVAAEKDYVDKVGAALKPKDPPMADPPKDPPVADPPNGDGPSAAATEALFLVIDCREAISEVVVESGLPDVTRAKIKKLLRAKRFADVTEAKTAAEGAIKEEREYLAAVGGPPRVAGVGHAREAATEAGKDKLDKVQLAMDGFFAGEAVGEIRPFMGVNEAFYVITGKLPGVQVGPEEMMGEIASYKGWKREMGWNAAMECVVPMPGQPFRRVAEAITTSTFGQILGDSINRKMQKDFARHDLQTWRAFCSIESVSDFRTQRRPMFGGYGTLTAYGEGENVPLATSPGDDEETYSISKRGLRESITIETIANDDKQLIRRIPIRLGGAAARGLYNDVYAVFTNNGNMYDGTALFHADHGNTNTTALSAVALRNIRTAMMDQASYGDSDDILGMANIGKFILVPNELVDLAWTLTNSKAAMMDVIAGDSPDPTLTAPNVPQNLDMAVIPVPHWTNAGDYFVIGDPANGNTVEVGFWQGRQTPELFFSDNPSQGALFSTDKVEIKGRFVYGVKALDWRGLYWENV